MPHSYLPRGHAKPIHLAIASEANQLFLAALLQEWQFTIVDEPGEETLCLADDGYPLRAPHGPVVWLTRSGFAARDRLPVPLAMEDLWGALETRFHRPPRHHLRIGIDMPAEITVRGSQERTEILSLSDLGARLRLSREVASGEECVVRLTIDGVPLRLAAKAIYVLPIGDLDDSCRVEVGLLFTPLLRETQARLRNFITATILERVRPTIPGWAFEVGVALLDLPDAVRKRL